MLEMLEVKDKKGSREGNLENLVFSDRKICVEGEAFPLLPKQSKERR